MSKSEYIRENEFLKDQEQYQSNEIYTQYRPIIDDVLLARKFPNHILNELYVSRRITRRRDELIDELYAHHLSEADKAKALQVKYDLSAAAFEFLNDYFSVKDSPEMDRLQVLLGDIGVGKSTLLQHLFYNILVKKEKYLKPEFIIWVDLWQKISDEHATRVTGGKELKVEISSQIYSHIYHNYEKNTPNFNSDLWDHISSLEVSHRFVNEVARISRCPAAKKKEEVNKILGEISEDADKDFDFNILRIHYLNTINDDKICLVIDNSDTVPDILHSQVMSLSLLIASKAKINVICTLRYSTFQLLACNPLRQAEDYVPLHCVLAPPDLAAIIEKRLHFIQKVIDESDMGSCRIAIRGKTIVIDKHEIFDAIRAFIDIFATAENAKYLMAISNNDIRRCFLLIDRLIQVDKINFDFARIIKKIVSDANIPYSYLDAGVPLWEVIKLHFLNRHNGFISDSNSVLDNIYCCKMKKHGNTLIKYRILQILAEKDSPWRLWDFIEFFTKYFSYSEVVIKSAFGQLLKSPLRLVYLSNGEPSLYSKNDNHYDQTLVISEAGRYYYDEFCTNFDYITHVFYDTYKDMRFTHKYKNFVELSMLERFDIVLTFGDFINSRNIDDFLGNPDSLPVYFSKTGVKVSAFPEFRIIEGLRNTLHMLSPRSYGQLKLSTGKVAEYVQTCNSRLELFLQNYETKFPNCRGPGIFPTKIDLGPS